MIKRTEEWGKIPRELVGNFEKELRYQDPVLWVWLKFFHT